MPAAEESDDWSDEDPWGSDFETDDDDGTSRVAEEDPYDSVEVMPISQRRRPVSITFIINVFSDPIIVSTLQCYT